MTESNDDAKYLDPDYDCEADPDYDPEKDPLYKRAMWLIENHPIVHTLTQVLASHERIKFFQRHGVPNIAENEMEIREKRLDRLAEMVPVSTQNKDGSPKHTVAYTLDVLRGEISEGVRNDPTAETE